MHNEQCLFIIVFIQLHNMPQCYSSKQNFDISKYNAVIITLHQNVMFVNNVEASNDKLENVNLQL